MPPWEALAVGWAVASSLKVYRRGVSALKAWLHQRSNHCSSFSSTASITESGVDVPAVSPTVCASCNRLSRLCYDSIAWVFVESLDRGLCLCGRRFGTLQPGAAAATAFQYSSLHCPTRAGLLDPLGNGLQPLFGAVLSGELWSRPDRFQRHGEQLKFSAAQSHHQRNRGTGQLSPRVVRLEV